MELEVIGGESFIFAYFINCVLEIDKVEKHCPNYQEDYEYDFKWGICNFTLCNYAIPKKMSCEMCLFTFTVSLTSRDFRDRVYE